MNRTGLHRSPASRRSLVFSAVAVLASFVLAACSSPAPASAPKLAPTPASAVTHELLPNPGAENGSASPTGWTNRRFGANSSFFTWVSDGGHSGSRSLRVDTTAATKGDGKWVFTP